MNFEWERGFELLDRISLRCYKVYVKFLLKTGLFGLLSLLMWANAFAVSGPFTVNVDVPPGQWKAARLKNLPKDATLAVKVESSGDVIVGILDSTSKENQIHRDRFSPARSIGGSHFPLLWARRATIIWCWTIAGAQNQEL